MSDFNSFLNQLRNIESNTFFINESDDNKDNNSSSNELSDAELDNLLKGGNSSGDNAASTDGDKDDLNNLPDLNDLDNKSDNSNPDNSSPEDLENLDKEGSADKNFETDSDGLIDTITKLTKAGKTVKILVSAEGKQYFDVDGKKINNFKQLSEYASKSVKGGFGMQENNILNSIMSQLNSLNKRIDQINGVTTADTLSEDKNIKIKESDYHALVEMCEDLNRKVDEQSAIIKMYETINDTNIMDENSDNNFNKILDDLSESIDVLNQATSKRDNYLSYNLGTDISISIINEDIMPILTSLSDVKAKLLSELDVHDTLISESFTDTSKLDSIITWLSESNTFDRVKTLINTRLSNSRSFSKKEIMRLLDEATSDIVIIPEPEAEFNSTPTNGYPYSGFEQRVKSILQTAMSKSGSYKSEIFIAPEDNGSNFISRSASRRIDLPIYKPEKYNVTTTVKSAILNLAESLTDIDGNINLDMAKKAYLYKKTSKPSSLKDFAFPIAICENKKLYAHPELIKTAANILKDDKCMKVYGIDSREILYQLRESLNPYLEEIKVDIPWLALDESKKTKAKKCKCKECGAECDECSKDGLCPSCEKEAKKASKKKGKK